MAIDLSEFEKLFGERVVEREARVDDDMWAIYCRDCGKMVEYRRRGRRRFCAVCRSKNLSVATKRALRNVYKLDENDEKPKKVA